MAVICVKPVTVFGIGKDAPGQTPEEPAVVMGAFIPNNNAGKIKNMNNRVRFIDKAQHKRLRFCCCFQYKYTKNFSKNPLFTSP